MVVHKCCVCEMEFLKYDPTVLESGPPPLLQMIDDTFMFCGECKQLYMKREQEFKRLQRQMNDEIQKKYIRTVIAEIDRDKRGMIASAIKDGVM